MAQYVATKEQPEALGYAALRSDRVPEQLMLFERYTTKAFWSDVHMQSEEFKAFKAKLQAAGPEPLGSLLVAASWSLGRQVSQELGRHLELQECPTANGPRTDLTGVSKQMCGW